jgi:hypothetical protein
MLKNKFEKVNFDFYHILYYYRFIDKELYIHKSNRRYKSCINSNTDYSYNISIDDIKKEYNDLIDIRLYRSPISEWLNLVKEFAIYLRTAEKCFMYINDSSSCLYSEIINNKTILCTKKIDNQYNITISFENTKITDIMKTITVFDDPEKALVSFINIEVNRYYGKEMSNSFKFLSSDSPAFNDETDLVLFNNIRDIVNKYIVKTYDNILNDTIYKVGIYNRIHGDSDFCDFNIWLGIKKYGLCEKRSSY